MKAELESRHYGISLEEIRIRLKKGGALKVKGMSDYSRVVYDINKKERKFLRIRQGAGKTSFTIKQISNSEDIRGTLEKEIQIPGHLMKFFIDLFEMMNIRRGPLQETMREIWSLPVSDRNHVEVCIDQWPGIKPLVEIEADHEDHIKQAEAILELHTRFQGDVVAIYKKELGLSKRQFQAISHLSFRSYPAKK